MGIWILFGLVVGVLAEFLASEHSPQKSVFAILLAIGGAIEVGISGSTWVFTGLENL
jgi:uncharacterized membrane protein YeaQ/YmgE (transglycosylase-associated protein family)